MGHLQFSLCWIITQQKIGIINEYMKVSSTKMRKMVLEGGLGGGGVGEGGHFYFTERNFDF